MPIKSVYVVGVDRGVDKLFKGKGYTLADSEDDADAVVFTGGSDIYPFLYGENPLEYGFYNLKRDKEEIRLFKSLPPGKPKIGICRGGQLFNVLCGGSMWQNVDGHNKGKTHPMKDFATGEIIEVTSVHHQLMIPSDQAFVIAGAQEAMKKQGEHLSISYTKEGRAKDWDDPEVLFYKNFNALCFQGHPEHPGKELEPMREYFFGLIKFYLDGNG